jgi:MFS family permease
MRLSRYPKLYMGIAFSGFSLVMAVGLTKAFLPLMAHDLDPVGTLVGFVTASWFFARIFIDIPSGIILIKFGKRKLILAGLLISTASPIVCAYSDSIYLLILGMMLWGFGAAIFFTSSTVAFLDLFQTEKRGQALGILQGIELMGYMVGAPVGAAIATSFGYGDAFLLSSLIVFTGFLITFVSGGNR